jgi:hypothetical protein
MSEVNPDQPPETLDTSLRPKPSGQATASLILGILSLFGWCLPILGLPMSITGLVLGIKNLGAVNRGAAIAGIVMNVIGLMLSLINAAIGAYMAISGQL